MIGRLIWNQDRIERDAVAWAVGIVTPEEIDKINILNASFLARSKVWMRAFKRTFKPQRLKSHLGIISLQGFARLSKAKDRKSFYFGIRLF